MKTGNYIFFRSLRPWIVASALAFGCLFASGVEVNSGCTCITNSLSLGAEALMVTGNGGGTLELRSGTVEGTGELIVSNATLVVSGADCDASGASLTVAQSGSLVLKRSLTVKDFSNRGKISCSEGKHLRVTGSIDAVRAVNMQGDSAQRLSRQSLRLDLAGGSTIRLVDAENYLDANSGFVTDATMSNPIVIDASALEPETSGYVVAARLAAEVSPYIFDLTGAEGAGIYCEWSTSGGAVYTTVYVYLAGTIPPTTENGIPTEWLAAYFGEGLSAETYEQLSTAEAANGMEVLDCYVAGLDPTDPLAAFTLYIDITGSDPTACRLTWLPDLGQERRYTVMGRELLETGDWAVLGSDTWDGSLQTNLYDHVASPPGETYFFKVECSLKEGGE